MAMVEIFYPRCRKIFATAAARNASSDGGVLLSGKKLSGTAGSIRGASHPAILKKKRETYCLHGSGHISRSFGVRWRPSHRFGREGDGDDDRASITRCVSSRFHRPPKAVALPQHSKVLRTKWGPCSSPPLTSPCSGASLPVRPGGPSGSPVRGRRRWRGGRRRGLRFRRPRRSLLCPGFVRPC